MKRENHNNANSNQALVNVGNPLFDDMSLFAGKSIDELAARFLRATQRKGVSSTKQKHPIEETAAAPE